MHKRRRVGCKDEATKHWARWLDLFIAFSLGMIVTLIILILVFVHRAQVTTL